MIDSSFRQSHPATFDPLPLAGLFFYTVLMPETIEFESDLYFWHEQSWHVILFDDDGNAEGIPVETPWVLH